MFCFKNTKFYSLLLLSVLTVACGSKPTEEYVDYFYSKNGSDQDILFTYILYLGEEGKSISQHQREHRAISTERDRNGNGRKSSQTRSTNASEEDALVSISFRMEEEAFKRLELMLTKKGVCSEKPEYIENEYTWLRYTIKGKCK